MNFLLQIILTIILSTISELFFPWWTIAICCFFVSILIKNKAFQSFFGGFCSISFLWMIAAAIIDVKSNYIVSTKIGPLFGFKSSIALVLFTGFLGGLIGGFAAISGYYVRKILENLNNSSNKGYGYLS